MARTRTVYRCSECGYETGRWLGRCPSCGAWNALSEAQTAPMRTQSGSGPAPQAPLLGELPQTQDARSGGFAFLCFLFPIVGLILYLVWKDTLPLRAKSCGKGAIIGVIVSVVFSIIYAVIIVALAGAAGAGTYY